MTGSLEIINEQGFLRVNQAGISRLVHLVLKGERAKRRDVTLLVCDDKRIRALNRCYFGKDRSTDVIAFGNPETALATDKNYLGDIVVSAETARRVCGRYGTTAQREFERYVAHGTLHLLGYDDRVPADYKIMHTQQEKYLEEFHQRTKRAA